MMPNSNEVHHPDGRVELAIRHGALDDADGLLLRDRGAIGAVDEKCFESIRDRDDPHPGRRGRAPEVGAHTGLVRMVSSYDVARRGPFGRRVAGRLSLGCWPR
mgnify:CR=1 FL=1